MMDDARPAPVSQPGRSQGSGGARPSARRGVAILARIYGRVQGVGFRYWARTQAMSLSLKGYVRNLTDGTVELLLIGEAQDVARMLTYCEEGPPTAEVSKVETGSPPKNQKLDFDRFRRAPTREPGAPV